MKATCPLFKQQGLSVHIKVKNLTTLASSQLELKVTADMEDLEKAINNASDDQMKDEDEEIENVQDDASTHIEKEVINIHRPQWLLKDFFSRIYIVFSYD